MDAQSPFRFVALLTADGVILHGTPPELAGRRVWEVVGLAQGSGGQERWRDLLARALESGESQSLDEELVFEGQPADLRVTPIEQTDGTARLLALESHGGALHDRDLMLTCGQRLAGLGSWIWDLEADRLTWSEETQRILGMGPEEFDGSFEGFLGFVNTDDHAALRDIVRQAHEGERRYSYRYRFRGKDPAAGERLITGEGEGQFAPSGRLLRIIGTVMDMTERERERHAIRDSEARFRSLVELSTDWYWEQDAQLRFSSFSGGRFAHHGKRAAMIGKRRWELPGEPICGSWAEHRALVESRRPFRDFEYRLQGGEFPRWISVAGEPFWDEAGKFSGYRGTACDITQRKLAAERQDRDTAMLRMAMRVGRTGAWSMDVASGEITWADGGRVVYSREGAAARNLDELLDRLSAPGRSETQEAFENCARNGTSFELEVQLDAAAYPAMWVRLIGEAERSGSAIAPRIQGTIQDVTARRFANQSIRKLSDRGRDGALSRAECLVTLDRQGKVSHLNLEAERLLRRSRGELAGRLLWDEIPALRSSTLEAACSQVARSGVPGEVEEFFEAVGHWLHVRIFPSPQGVAVYLRDLTDPSSVREAFLESQEQFRNLFEHSINGVLCLDSGGRITRANPAACALLGAEECRLQGRAFRSLLAPGEERLQQLWDVRRSVGRVTGHVTIVKEQPPETFDAEIASAEYADSNGNLHSFVVLRDISRRLRHEQEIRALNADLAARVHERTAELEARNAELKAFAHSLAHDLRSPIAAIDGFADMAQSSLSNGTYEKAAHCLERVRASARKMDEFTEGLLSLARVSQAPMERSAIDLSALAQAVLEGLQENDPQRKVRSRVQPHLVAQGDARLVRMALENLLGNAWKFTCARKEAEIEFSCRVDPEGRATYRIRDNGAGFDMQYADRLFSSFQRLHNQSEFPGTGIGLANVRRIIVRHGGRVWAEGSPGQGASFYFTLGDAAQGKAAQCRDGISVSAGQLCRSDEARQSSAGPAAQSQRYTAPAPGCERFGPA